MPTYETQWSIRLRENHPHQRHSAGEHGRAVLRWSWRIIPTDQLKYDEDYPGSIPSVRTGTARTRNGAITAACEAKRLLALHPHPVVTVDCP